MRRLEAEMAGRGGAEATAAAVLASGARVDYGLRGLEGIMHKTDRALTEMALGNDLTRLGLNLKQPSVVSSLGVPYTDIPATRPAVMDPPASFRVRAPALRAGHLQKMELETLLFAFYAMPRDMAQLAAAHELYDRGWRLHRDSKLWVRPSRTEADGTAVPLTVFDVQAWQQRPYEQMPEEKVLSAVVPQEEVAAAFAGAVTAHEEAAARAAEATALAEAAAAASARAAAAGAASAPSS
jgi:hypothetical protein